MKVQFIDKLLQGIDALLDGDISFFEDDALESTDITFSKLFDDNYMHTIGMSALKNSEKIQLIGDVTNYLMNSDLIASTSLSLLKKSQLNMNDIEAFYNTLKVRLQAYYNNGQATIPYDVSLNRLAKIVKFRKDVRSREDTIAAIEESNG